MNVDCHRRAVAEANLFIGPDPYSRSVSGGFPFAAPNCNHSLVAVGIDVEPVVAGLHNCERLIGRIDFVSFVVIETAHMKIQSSLVKLKLYKTFSDIGYGKAALRANADQAAPHTQFRARVLVSPDVICVGEGSIDLACNPIARALGLDRYRSIHIPQARHTRWRVRGPRFGVVLRVVLRSFQRLIFGRRSRFILVIILILIVLLIRWRGLIIRLRIVRLVRLRII